jgi:hypothetical protein
MSYVQDKSALKQLNRFSLDNSMSLVKVWTDLGGRKPVALLAKIIDKDGVILTIKYLTSGKDGIWRYEGDTYEVDDDSIADYLNTDDETKIGFKAVDDGFVQDNELSDDDYEPEEEEEEEDEDEDDETEEEEDDMVEEEFEEEDDEDEEEYVEE